MDAAERIYGINRPELKRLRYNHYMIYNAARITAEDTQTPMNLRQMWFDIVESMKQPGSAWTGMILFFEDQRGPMAFP